ncbi:hypothetical protein GGI07_003858 [Coemansia sp. Benny D115]|nr:hypothetical protein GGI07_003858 [Coemansia sp. Benny D115]
MVALTSKPALLAAAMAAGMPLLAAAQQWGYEAPGMLYGSAGPSGFVGGAALYPPQTAAFAGAVAGGIAAPWTSPAYGAGFGAAPGYGSAGGLIPTGYGHGIIQGASTGGAIIQGPSGVIVAPPQSAGSIVF